MWFCQSPNGLFGCLIDIMGKTNNNSNYSNGIIEFYPIYTKDNLNVNENLKKFQNPFELK